jgi:hypothetical protein
MLGVSARTRNRTVTVSAVGAFLPPVGSVPRVRHEREHIVPTRDEAADSETARWPAASKILLCRIGERRHVLH